ncbi:MAG: lasso peptide biosynthesis B2 protein [Actinobacteria bacterium]|nr:lasso peptide biosynthesis B2 protein [Actinomycetota bacterium]
MIVAWLVVRAQLLARRPWRSLVVPSPPSADASRTWVVRAALRRLRVSCLPRTLVLQRWLSDCGDPRDVIVGVSNRPVFRAHAWLDGAVDGQGFHELSRRAAPAPRPAGARRRAGG